MSGFDVEASGRHRSVQGRRPTTTLLIFAIQGISACCYSFKDPPFTLSTVVRFCCSLKDDPARLFKAPLSTIFKTTLYTLSISSRLLLQRGRCFGTWMAHLGTSHKILSHASVIAGDTGTGVDGALPSALRTNLCRAFACSRLSHVIISNTIR